MLSMHNSWMSTICSIIGKMKLVHIITTFDDNPVKLRCMASHTSMYIVSCALCEYI